MEGNDGIKRMKQGNFQLDGSTFLVKLASVTLVLTVTDKLFS